MKDETTVKPAAASDPTPVKIPWSEICSSSFVKTKDPIHEQSDDDGDAY